MQPSHPLHRREVHSLEEAVPVADPRGEVAVRRAAGVGQEVVGGVGVAAKVGHCQDKIYRHTKPDSIFLIKKLSKPVGPKLHNVRSHFCVGELAILHFLINTVSKVANLW